MVSNAAAVVGVGVVFIAPRRLARLMFFLCLRLVLKAFLDRPSFFMFVWSSQTKEKERGPTPDMCVISKNYLLYVKRQIHGW